MSRTLRAKQTGRPQDNPVGVHIRRVALETPATLDPATCLTAWCVAVDTFCKAHVPDPPPSLCGSEVVTLAIFGQ